MTFALTSKKAVVVVFLFVGERTRATACCERSLKESLLVLLDLKGILLCFHLSDFKTRFKYELSR